MPDDNTRLQIAARVLRAYVSGNNVPAETLPILLGDIHRTLRGLAGPVAASGVAKPTPQQIAESIRSDAIVSFENGQPYRVLRRHLMQLGITPQAYRAKWGLPVDYPLVAAGYSARRSEIARDTGLGRVGRTLAAPR